MSVRGFSKNRSKPIGFSCVVALALVAASAGSGRAAPRLAFGYKSASVQGVFVVRVDGLNRHRVTHGLNAARLGGFRPDWSPDGTRIAFAARVGFGIDKIYTVRPNGSGQRRITGGARCFGDNGPDWSAHSQHIVFQREHCDPVTLWSVKRDGTRLTRLTDPPVYEATVEAAPRWSPDSHWIAFTRSYNDPAHIWVMRRDGSEKTQLTFSPSSEDDYPRDVTPQWSPDSTTLVYTEYRVGPFFDPVETDVCTVPITGGSRNCLTNAAGVDIDGHYSPDGQHIVFVSDRDGTRDIYVMDADGSNEHPISASAGVDDQPEWSPNGNWIAFLSDRGGQVELYVIHPDGTGLRRLTRSPGVEDAPTWAPG